MTRRGPGLHVRAFGALLRLYPSWFRESYGDEMRELFVRRLSHARAGGGVGRLWLRVIRDAFETAVRLERSRPGPQRRRRRMGTLGKELRHAARQLVRAPVFTLGAVLLLAVGIGANVVVFTLADALLFRPPPFERPEEVVYVYEDSDEGVPTSSSFPSFRDMARSDVFAAVAATSPATLSWEGPDGPVEASIEFTTSRYLEVLGLSASRGRFFDAEHDVVGNAPVAVVSAATWRTRMGADPGVVGSTIRLNGQPVTIIGVGPSELAGTYAPTVTDFWLSISATPVGGSFRVANLERREDHWYDVRARLAPGVSVEQAQSAMDALALALGDAFPELQRGRDITVFRSSDVRMHPQEDAALFSSAWLLAGIVLTLLLLACANLANLLLARGIGRSGEMAVRRAIGAGTGTVARLYLLESLLLSAAGCVMGVLLARWALSAMHAVPLPFPLSATLDLPMDERVVVFSLLAMIFTGLVSGIAPAVRSARQDVAITLRDDRRSSPTGRGTVRLRNALVAVQVGASLVLILGAGLLARSLAALQNLDTGVDAGRVAWIRTSLAQSGIAADATTPFVEELRSRLESVPGAQRVAIASRLPAQGAGSTTTIVEGYTPPSGTGAIELSFTVVSPEYFETAGLALTTGRGFEATDVQGGERVVLINETAARTFWPGGDPLGRRLRSQAQPDLYRTVVGVVADAPVNSLTEPVRPMFYAPLAQSGLGSFYILVRSAGDPDALIGPIRNEIMDFRSTLPVLAQGTLASHFSASLAGQRFATRLMGGVSLLAMLLAGLGTYAVVAFGVARRAAEMGIRLALGAEQGRVVRMVVGETAGTVLLGLAAGVTIAVLAAPRIEPVLFGVAALDPLTFLGAVLLLAGVATLAAYLPARRAARADPVRSLRTS